MRIRDGPAAVRGDAPPPRSHWRKPGRRRGREPRVRRPAALPQPDPLAEGRIQVLRTLVLLVAAALAALALSVAGASGGSDDARRPFPVTVVASNGKVTVTKRPTRIVSLSPTATESLFAIGAGSQVVAVDDQSDYPKTAPRTALSGLHAERRGDRRVPARSRRDRVRPEGPLGRARQARHHGPPPGRRARASRARTSRSASSGWSRVASRPR